MHKTKPQSAYDVVSDVMNGLRVTGGDSMTDAAKEARRAYKREWNRKNRDKVKAAQDRYWNKKAQEAADQAKASASMEG